MLAIHCLKALKDGKLIGESLQNTRKSNNKQRIPSKNWRKSRNSRPRHNKLPAEKNIRGRLLKAQPNNRHDSIKLIKRSKSYIVLIDTTEENSMASTMHTYTTPPLGISMCLDTWF